ncbi:MAG TPA: hypothetical protein VGQ12_00975 [Candidatus Angelobacter sp.]|jgi:hypothetical protein|nr:hypothetical protein [Candidatus Angelobacter sp.]
MNLTTWFKGLGVFALSSMITALATMQLDPASFNFSKAGLTKVGAAALVIGVKSVLLYLKQSPLPGSQQGRTTDWTKIASLLAFCVIIPAGGLLAGCVSSWDRTTYASLAASKALIDCAVAGYNHFDADIRHACGADSQNATQDVAFDPQTFYLPQTREAQQAVDKARQAQVTAVDAFAAYAVAKVAKDKSATLQEKQAAVVGLLEQFPALLNAVRGLMGKKPVGESQWPDARDPVLSIAALKPEMNLTAQ